MPNMQNQCHIRLELERVVLLSGIQTSERIRATDDLDSLEQQMLQQMRVKLHRVESALQRLAQGTFGLCQACRQSIDAERLLALPHAELCVDCQRELEQTTIKRYRMRQTYKAAA